MAKDPVATAASNNPDLSTLATAVRKAGLVDTLNNARNITVFAPTHDAFAKIPKADLDKVLSDKATLTKILTYHVVGEKLAPAQLASGTYPTLEKGTLTTAGSGESYTVNDSAEVVCGKARTRGCPAGVHPAGHRTYDPRHTVSRPSCTPPPRAAPPRPPSGRSSRPCCSRAARRPRSGPARR